MREIQAELLTNTVAQMCIRANYDLPRDVLRQLDKLQATEVYVHAPEPEEMGLAVYNRLLRAAAFRVVQL